MNTQKNAKIPPTTVKSRKLPRSSIKVIPLRILSILCLILGLFSIGIQTAALIFTNKKMSDDAVFYGYDAIGCGIWAGSLSIATGSLGLASTTKKTTKIMIGTVVMASMALIASTAASVLSGKNAGEGYWSYCEPYDACESWLALEWTLFGISFTTFLSLIPLLILASFSLCCAPQNI